MRRLGPYSRHTDTPPEVSVYLGRAELATCAKLQRQTRQRRHRRPHAGGI